MTITRVVNRSVNPLLVNLPAWLECYRPEQIKAIDEIRRAFDEVDLVVLDAPTGSGKTLIAETVRLMLEVDGLYVCSSIGLQDQFVRLFPYSQVVKGRRNYPTGNFPLSYPERSCDDCTWTVENASCSWCERKRECPYEMAKLAGLRCPVTVVNSAYAVTEWNGPGRFGGRGLVILDEADVFEGAVKNHVSVAVSRFRMGKYRWVPPDRVTVVDSWRFWLDMYIPKAKARLEGEEDEKERKFLERLVDKLGIVQQQLEAGLPYAFTGKNGNVEWKPVMVDEYCQDAVWKHGRKWLLMSATTISAQERLRSLGWGREWRLVTMPSTFPVENRRVKVRPVANMSRNTREDQYARLETAIRNLVASEEGRVVIHTVSYRLARDILSSLSRSGRPVFGYQLAGERTAAISEYLRTVGSVLVAPSADRGIDLPDDACRLQIIAKVPYPDLGDRMVSMRMHMPGGQLWYTAETVRSIVQMSGRGIRHKDDWCETVILDSQFGSGVWSKGRGLFPQWYREAIVWERV